MMVHNTAGSSLLLDQKVIKEMSELFTDKDLDALIHEIMVFQEW